MVGLNFLITRHAETDWNRHPRRLQGRADVRLSNAWLSHNKPYKKSILSKYEPDVIYSSPATRCLQTARLVFGDNIQVNIDEGLWEINNGFFSGELESDIKNIHSTLWGDWKKTPELVRPGGGETLQEMSDRVYNSICSILNKNKNKEYIHIIMHGGPIRVLMCRFNQIPLRNFHDISVDNMETFSIVKKKNFFLINRLGIL